MRSEIKNFKESHSTCKVKNRPRSLLQTIAIQTVITIVICTSASCHRSKDVHPKPDAESSITSSNWELAPQDPHVGATVTTPTTTLRFVEVQQQMQVQHVFHTGGEGKFLAVETLGGGCGWIDYDSDGLWDFVCNQGDFPHSKDRQQAAPDSLFRNVRNRFTRVDQPAKFSDPNFSQAIAIGDHDDDGFQDIYVSNVFENTFWKNNGDGTFTEAAQACGINDRRWSSTAAWADINEDGLLDLYVCNYLQYDPTEPVDCFDNQGRRVLCNPASLDPWPNALYINLGNGSFREESEQRGLAPSTGRSLSVAIADFTGDLRPDIYVANDTDDNFFFVNCGNGLFQEDAILRGCANNHLGIREAGMGIAVNDYDNNGFQDIYVTHYTEESNTLYKNLGDHGFQDLTNVSGLHQGTLPYLGFGTSMQDFDHNGLMDLLVANGHVVTAAHNLNQKMPAQVFSFDGRADWHEIGPSAGQFFETKKLGRGLATADFDNDGDLDVLILNLDQPASLLRNESTRANWISLSFRGSSSNRFGIGVAVELITTVDSKKTSKYQQLCAGTSFAATHQPILSFGLGAANFPIDLHITWPSGIKQTLLNVPINQHVIVDERSAAIKR